MTGDPRLISFYAAWGAERQRLRHREGRLEVARVGGFTAAVGDALALPDRDNSYDAALLLGPLYHLQARDDRLRALREAVRVVRKGGVVAAAYISRGAVALDGFVKGWIDRPGTLETMRVQLRDGFCRADDIGFGGLAYFHLPSETRAELAESGLELLGVEGPGWVAPDFDARWADPELQLLSAHLLAVCRV